MTDTDREASEERHLRRWLWVVVAVLLALAVALRLVAWHDRNGWMFWAGVVGGWGSLIAYVLITTSSRRRGRTTEVTE